MTEQAKSSQYSLGGQGGYFRSISVHPKYDPDTLKYDLALLQVGRLLNSSDTVQPVSFDLATLAKPKAGTNTTVLGWGITSETGRRLSLSLLAASD